MLLSLIRLPFIDSQVVEDKTSLILHCLLLVVMIRHQLNPTAPNSSYKFTVAIILSLTTIATLVNYKFCIIDPRISIKQSQNAVL